MQRSRMEFSINHGQTSQIEPEMHPEKGAPPGGAPFEFLETVDCRQLFNQPVGPFCIAFRCGVRPAVVLTKEQAAE